MTLDTIADRMLQAAYDAAAADTEMELSLSAVAQMAQVADDRAGTAYEYLRSRNFVQDGASAGLFHLTGYGIAAVKLQRSQPEVHTALDDLAVAVHACERLDDTAKADIICDIEALRTQLRKSRPDEGLLQRLWQSIDAVASPAGAELENALAAVQKYGWFLQ